MTIWVGRSNATILPVPGFTAYARNGVAFGNSLGSRRLGPLGNETAHQIREMELIVYLGTNRRDETVGRATSTVDGPRSF